MYKRLYVLNGTFWQCWIISKIIWWKTHLFILWLVSRLFYVLKVLISKLWVFLQIWLILDDKILEGLTWQLRRKVRNEHGNRFPFQCCLNEPCVIRYCGMYIIFSSFIYRYDQTLLCVYPGLIRYWCVYNQVWSGIVVCISRYIRFSSLYIQVHMIRYQVFERNLG